MIAFDLDETSSSIIYSNVTNSPVGLDGHGFHANFARLFVTVEYYEPSQVLEIYRRSITTRPCNVWAFISWKTYKRTTISGQGK